MKLHVPGSVLSLLEKADGAETRKHRAERAAQDAENARLRAIAELRLARREELWQAATAVFAWREAFVATEESGRIWRHLGDKARLMLYVDKFWRGEPAPPNDRTCSAVLAFEAWRPGAFGLPPFWYEERHKGRTSFEQRIISPQDLVDAVHPDFLARAAAHFAGPDAWKWILTDLERHTKR
ncbi:MAG TPA: hypothetical protein VL500_03000 [Candidatus Eisenbacteria bacterium]|nr:hypothetical protein [Candidatus Eisenbacteria bacterium]